MTNSQLNPIKLAPNVMRHQYKGGANLAKLRGIPLNSEFQPEEWLGSTSVMLHDASRGLSLTDDGRVLRDVISSGAKGWLGGALSTDRKGDTGFLLKLIDAGQRLPVHAHPDRKFATSRLSCPYGKTEAWFVLDAPEGAGIYLGLKEDISREEFEKRRDQQDSQWFLDLLHFVPVKRGTSLVIPAGELHAIDAGVFAVELQEPTDFSIVVEWSATSLTRDNSELGIGWPSVTDAISLKAMSKQELASLVSQHNLDRADGGVREMIASAARPFFSLLHAVAGSSDWDVGGAFAVVLAIDGNGAIDNGRTKITIKKGEAFAIPRDFGPWHLTGNVSALVASQQALSVTEGAVS
ncbi:phosphomannose isomerase [Rhizobium leguminosarum bv. trifolii WSM2012]|nr:phosphomannose isomerase [Rhizobium leguminosarum bv. trifolii WSM2012]EJC76921.1 phosphomannose isomerase [Rhizobium leguminosarum bv. trifolii WSM2012]